MPKPRLKPRWLIALFLALVLGASPAQAYDDCGEPCRVPVPWVPLTREEKWDQVSETLSPVDIWAHVVSGEAGGLPDGALLVAWTLRSWEVYRGMPADQAGPYWGWYGWKPPAGLHYDAVLSAWKQPLSNAPYEWMRLGKFCRHLGTDHDLAYWISLGWNVQLIYRLEWPNYNLSMNCIG